MISCKNDILYAVNCTVQSTINWTKFESAAMRESAKGNINFFLFSSGTERQNSAAVIEKKIEMRNMRLMFIGDICSKMCHL